MAEFSIKHKIIALVLVAVFIVLPLSKANKHTYSQSGVYICGPSACLDNSLNHLSFLCDNYHQIIY